MLNNDEIEYLRNNKELINQELLDALRTTKQGKGQALDILDLPKDDEEYYLDAFDNRISYQGDRSLKKPYTKINLSEIHIEELKRCFEDIRYFRDNYVRIRTPLDGVNFPDLRPYQNQIIEELQSDDEQYIILSPRQCITGDTIVGEHGETIAEIFSAGEHPMNDNTSMYRTSVLTKVKIKCEKYGWVRPMEILKTIDLDVLKLTFDDGTILKCSAKHSLILSNGEEIYAQDALNHEIKSIKGVTRCTSVEDTGIKEPMYDVVLLLDHHYYTNGILSHNSGKSITIATWLAWLYCFSKDIVIGICANKLSMAAEFLKNTKDILVQLPVWMTPGCKVWNVGSIGGDNGVRILTDSPSDSSFRGFSCNVIVVDECLKGDTEVTIRESISGSVKVIPIETLYERSELKKYLRAQFKLICNSNVDDYIDFCLFHHDESLNEGENHHLLPQALFPGSRLDKRNIVRLSIANHIKAHELLALAMPDNYAMVFAYNSMISTHRSQEVNARLRAAVRSRLSEINAGLVTAIENGKVVRIPVEEYRSNPNKYTTPSTGKVTVTDKATGKRIRISTDAYNKEIHLMHSAGNSTWYNPQKCEKCYTNKRPDGWVAGTVLINVLRNDSVVKVKACAQLPSDKFLGFYKPPPKPVRKRSRQTKEELAYKARLKYTEGRIKACKEAGIEYRKGKHIVKTRIYEKNRVVARDASGCIHYLTRDEYNSGDYCGVAKDLLMVVELSTGKIRRIPKHCYNQSIYSIYRSTGKQYRIIDGDREIAKGYLSELVCDAAAKNRLRRAAKSGNVLASEPYKGYKVEVVC